jgi:hypothetical protein
MCEPLRYTHSLPSTHRCRVVDVRLMSFTRARKGGDFHSSRPHTINRAGQQEGVYRHRQEVAVVQVRRARSACWRPLAPTPTVAR